MLHNKPQHTKATLKKVGKIIEYLDNADVFIAFLERIGDHHTLPTWKACLDYVDGNSPDNPFQNVISYAEKTNQLEDLAEEVLGKLSDCYIEEQWAERCKPETWDSKSIKWSICELVDVSEYASPETIIKEISQHIY